MIRKVIFIASLIPTLAFGQSAEEYFERIKTQKVISDPEVQWQNFGPGMSGYCEEFWCHPTDPSVMFMGPDMHVSYGSWDGGESWQSLKDPDGLGQDMKRVLDLDFSLQQPDFGMAIDWNGWIYQTSNRGRSWQRIGEFGQNYKDIGIDPNDPEAFSKGWYAEQRGTRHSELAVDPTNDQVWYVGAGDFWNVKSNHRSQAKPHGEPLKYAAYGYIWKTVDQGKTWQKITKGIPETTEVGKIIVNPRHADSLVMATNMGLMLSADGGMSWTDGGEGLPHNLPRDLTSYYDEASGEFLLYLLEQTVYTPAGETVHSEGGVYRSADGGKTWASISGNLSFDLSAMDYPAELDRYHRSMAHWFGISKQESKARFSQLPQAIMPVYNRIVVSPLDKDELYISYNKKHDFSFGPGDVWRSLDGGRSWKVVTRHGTYWEKGSDEAYWSERSNPSEPNIDFAHLEEYMKSSSESSGNRMMEINSLGELFVGIDQQTLKSTDKGESWKQIDDDETSPGSGHWIGRGGSNLPGRYLLLETGIAERRLLSSGEHGLWQTVAAIDWPDPQAVAVQQIEGQVHPHGAHSVSTVAVHPQDPNIIYILSWRQDHRGKLRRTLDGGKTWENIASIFDADNNGWEGLAAQNSLLIDPQKPDNMYFCATKNMISEVGAGNGPKLSKGGYGFYKSTDGGYTWTLSNAGLPADASVRRLMLDPADPKQIYAAVNSQNGGLYKSVDQGDSWEKQTIPAQIQSVNNVFIDRNTQAIFRSTGRRTGSYEEGGVWKSSDQGQTWQQLFKAPFVWQAESSPVNPDLIVISVAGQAVSMADDFMNPGIYLSTDAGASWTKINKGLGQPDKIVDVKPDPYNENILWCASWGAGWYITYLNGYQGSWLPSGK